MEELHIHLVKSDADENAYLLSEIAEFQSAMHAVLHSDSPTRTLLLQRGDLEKAFERVIAVADSITEATALSLFSLLQTAARELLAIDPESHLPRKFQRAANAFGMTEAEAFVAADDDELDAFLPDFRVDGFAIDGIMFPESGDFESPD